MPLGVVLLIALVLTLPAASITSPDSGKGFVESRFTLASQSYVSHSPILIESEQDLIDQGLPGSGSDIDPYVINWLDIDLVIGEACLNISNTRSRIIIENCRFASPDFSHAIQLRNTSSIIIRDIVILSMCYIIQAINCSDITMNDFNITDCVVVLDYSSSCVVSGVAVDTAPGDAFSIMYCSQITLDGCTASNCAAYGIYLAESLDCTITDNVAFGNDMAQICIDENSHDNRIYGNHITATAGNTARDNGFDNHWDDGISHGNWWSDWTGTSGFYYIPGTANSVDHYPMGPGSSTTSTITTTGSPTIPIQEGVIVTEWYPLEMSSRIAVVVLLGAMYGVLVFIFIYWRRNYAR